MPNLLFGCALDGKSGGVRYFEANHVERLVGQPWPAYHHVARPLAGEGSRLGGLGQSFYLCVSDYLAALEGVFP